MTPRQEAFIGEYLKDRNATKAAIRAGYSRKTARQIGDRLLSKADIRAAVDAKFEEIAEKAGLHVQMVLESLVRELVFDPVHLFDEFGRLKPLNEIPPDIRKCIVSIETVQVGSEDAPAIIRKIRWAQPAQAREQAMRHLGMFEKDNEKNKQPAPITRIELVGLCPK